MMKNKVQRIISIIILFSCVFCGVFGILLLIDNGLSAEDLKTLDLYYLETGGAPTKDLLSQLSNLHNITTNLVFLFCLIVLFVSLPFAGKWKLFILAASIGLMGFWYKRITACKMLVQEMLNDSESSQLDFVSEIVNRIIFSLSRNACSALLITIFLFILFFVKQRYSLKAKGIAKRNW